MRYFYNKRVIEFLGGHFAWLWSKRLQESSYVFMYWPVQKKVRSTMKRKRQSLQQLHRQHERRLQGRGRHWLWRKKR